MKKFFYTGTNDKNLSGVSWKIWKIERTGKSVTVWWGPIRIVRRKVLAVGTLQSRQWRFRSEAEAKLQEERRVQQKLLKGYERIAGT